MGQSISDSLKSMTEVKPGDFVGDVASSKRINAIQDAIRSLARGDNFVSGPNILKKTGEGWVSITGQPGGGAKITSQLRVSFKFSSGASNPTPDAPPDPVGSTRILIADGKVNGAFPAGMGYGNYTFLVTEACDIWAGMSYNPGTLEISDIYLNFGTFPEPPPLGTLYIYLGFVYVQDGEFIEWNTHLGDLNFQFIYGNKNGRPALIPLPIYSGFIEIGDLFPA